MGSSASSEALKEKTVVVIGCSFAGKAIAYPLRGKCNLVVIDTRDAMHITLAAPRAVVQEDFAKRSLIPIREVFGDSFKQGTVKDIDPSLKKVTLATGEEISFDYLVIATGSSGPFPGKIDSDVNMEQALEKYKEAYNKVKAAKKIAIVGGGAVGVEIAGESATDYPEKEVTIIHSRDTLVEPAVSESLRASVKNELEALNVKILLGERVANLADIPRDLSGATLQTEKGTSIEADLVFVCIGMTVNSDSYSKGLASCMDERGSLKVNSFLQVEGHDCIFAAGDCCNADVQKMALRAGKQGEAVLQNICLHAQGSALKPYSFSNMVFAISIGRERGFLQVGWIVLGSWLVKRMKSHDLLTGRMWGEWGLTAPQVGNEIGSTTSSAV